MAGFGMMNPRNAAVAKKKAMMARTASKAAAAPGGAMDQTTKTIKKAGRQPPGPPMTAGPAKATSEKAGKTRTIGGSDAKGKMAALAAAKSAGLNVQKQMGFAAKKGPAKGRNNGRGDSGGVM